MRQIAIKSVLVLSLLSLTACSTNTQSENTGIGAGAGAIIGGLAGSLFGQGTGKAVAVGIGAIAGAVLGGYIGHSMDNSDHVQCANTLSNNSTHHATHWKNNKTGTSYTMTPTSKMMSYNGNSNCRQFETVATFSDGSTKKTSGIACRQGNGSWQEMAHS